MRKRTIGILYILSVVLFLVGIGLFVAGLIGSTSVYDPYTGNNNITSMGHPTLVIAGIILYMLAFVPFLIAWIGALVNLARLQQWVWFVLMFLFSPICLIVYLFAGPETSNVFRYPDYSSQQPPPFQPPQNYSS